MGPRMLGLTIMFRARIQGFLVFDYAQYYDAARARLARWVKEGKLKYKEQVVKGLENAPKAFISLMHGENFGKLMVQVAGE
jgi:NADPH-dependent curcumin reductase CurA